MNSDPSVIEAQNTAVVAWLVAVSPWTSDRQEKMGYFVVYNVSTYCWCISFIIIPFYQYPVYHVYYIRKLDPSVNEAQHTAVVAWTVAGTP